MNSQSGISYDNAAVASCPKHLLQFAVDQRYDDYTSVDHAVWRFIMRQNMFFLKEYAHKVYFQGLLNTGISFDRIPRIQEMNDILAKIGWGAVAVDGFIPPAAFMEFQAYKVLVIACDMRQIHHIEYTPAPDIVHEAAGHAPIIVDREYSEYLQRFGEVGAKAMSSKKDFELYQAIRHLSILKERPNADPKEVEEATRLVEHHQTAAAFCLPRFSAPQGCAGRIREQNGIQGWRPRRDQQGNRMQECCHLRIFIRLAGRRSFHRSHHRRRQVPDLSADKWQDGAGLPGRR